MPSDKSRELLRRFERGDRHALPKLIELHLDWLRLAVRARIGTKLRLKLDEEDIVQSVLVEVFEETKTFHYQGEAAFRRWIYQVAEHKIRNKADFFSRQRRDVAREQALETSAAGCEPQLLVESSTPSRACVRREEEDRLFEALDRLAPKDREIIILRQIEEQPWSEVARRVGASERNVYRLYARAVDHLTRLLRLPNRTHETSR
ncbi:MAG: RNA polymerase sigma factor [Planctomycetota bacterium]